MSIKRVIFSILKLLSLAIIVIVCVVYYLLNTADDIQKREEYNLKYFKENPLELTGIVGKTIPWTHSWGIVTLDVRKTSKQLFDPFALGQNYFPYYVHGSYAELYLEGLSQYEAGDSMIISTMRDSMYVYKSGQLSYSGNLYVYTNSPEFTNWIKENHKEK